jgi:hypothetical protein
MKKCLLYTLNEYISINIIIIIIPINDNNNNHIKTIIYVLIKKI